MVGGCSDDSGDQSAASSGRYEDMALPDAGPRNGDGSRPESEPLSAKEQSAAELSNAENASGSSIENKREIVRTAYVSMVVATPPASADTVVKIVEKAGGLVSQRTDTSASEHTDASASMTLRIPEATLTATLNELKGLGEVMEHWIESDDVTLLAKDLDAQIEALQLSVKRLQRLLAEADSVTNLLAVERELATRQAELDSLMSQRKTLSDQVSMATVAVELTAPGTATGERPRPGESTSVLDALSDGWGTFVGFLKGFVLVVAYTLPWLVIIGAIGVPLFIKTRRSVTARRAASNAATATIIGRATRRSGPGSPAEISPTPDNIKPASNASSTPQRDADTDDAVSSGRADSTTDSHEVPANPPETTEKQPEEKP